MAKRNGWQRAADAHMNAVGVKPLDIEAYNEVIRRRDEAAMRFCEARRRLDKFLEEKDFRRKNARNLGLTLAFSCRKARIMLKSRSYFGDTQD